MFKWRRRRPKGNQTDRDLEEAARVLEDADFGDYLGIYDRRSDSPGSEGDGGDGDPDRGISPDPTDTGPQREMRHTDRSTKAVLNDALRIGRGAHDNPARPSKFEVDPHPFGFKPNIDSDRLNQLVDELEVEELARKLRR